MELKKVKEMLENEGLEVTERTVMKYGEETDALTIGSGNVQPTLYEETVKDLDVDQVIKLVKDALKGNENMEMHAKNMMDPSFIKKNVIPCLRHITDDDSIVKMTVRGDLEMYFRVVLPKFAGEDGIGTVIITPEILDTTGISRNEIYEASMKNLKDQAEIKSMFEIIKEMMGVVPFEQPDDERMFVATTKSKVQGASVMECKELLDDFCRDHAWKGVAIIPSSVHEVILIPVTDDMDQEQMNNLINEVNITKVSEHERLSDHLYFNYI